VIGSGWYRQFSLAVFLATLVTGCDSKPQRLGLHGRVTVDGKPLSFGSIMFVPDGIGPKANALIRDGEYQIEVIRGPLAGGKVVQISTPQFPPGQPIPKSENELIHLAADLPEGLPSRYNSASELHVNVTDDGPNEFNFELTTK
jgi:hypothetical protein